MLRFAGLCAALGLVAVVMALPASADDKAPSIEEIMKKLHGKAGSHKVVGKSLDAAELDWDSIAKHAKIYADLSASLEKNTPEKGDKKAWDKLSQLYAKDAKALSEAAAKKDKEAAKAVFARLKESCDACHENHR
ncbi:MAG TPA: cytochrome c [Gemmataceae bacterium]|jgi:cytochrome c556|nr:cytochrome c [Gemmataceae bacterium]